MSESENQKRDDGNDSSKNVVDMRAESYDDDSSNESLMKDTFDVATNQVSSMFSENDVDVALNFLKNVERKGGDVEEDTKNADDLEGQSEVDFTDERVVLKGSKDLSKKTMRRLDLVILSFLCVTYFLMFLDKVLLNYAAAMGIKKNLKGDEFSNLSTIFGAGYIFMEPFTTYLFQKFPISKILGSFILCWGIVLTCHSACKTYASLMIVRVLLGIFESSSAAGCIAISGMYYTKSEQSARIGYWATQAGTGYVVGGLISFGFQHYHGKEFYSWQIMFLVVGLVTVAFGLLTFFYLPDNITNAWFLDQDQKIEVIEHIRSNQTGLENKKFKKEQVKELFFHDKLTWPMLLLTGCSQISTGAIGTFSVTITGTFGFDSYVTALLQLPIGGIVAIIIIVTTQMLAHWGHITLITSSMYVPAIIGCIVMLSLPLSNKVGNLLGLYLVYSGSCTITNIYIWNTWNTSGYCKRLFRNAATLIVYNVSCIVAPQMFRTNDYPHYTPAKIALLVTQCVCIPLQFYIGYLCKKENELRDKEQEGAPNVKYEFLDLTDIQNRSFRYIY